MELDRLSASDDQLAARIRACLCGEENTRRSRVIWRDRGNQISIDLQNVQVEMNNGWLVCRLRLQSGRLRPVNMDLVYYIGQDDDGDGLNASATVRITDAATKRLADLWGNHLLRVVWDGVLDVIEDAVVQVGRQRRGQKVQLVGFMGAKGKLSAETAAMPLRRHSSGRS